MIFVFDCELSFDGIYARLPVESGWHLDCTDICIWVRMAFVWMASNFALSVEFRWLHFYIWLPVELVLHLGLDDI